VFIPFLPSLLMLAAWRQNRHCLNLLKCNRHLAEFVEDIVEIKKEM